MLDEYLPLLWPWTAAAAAAAVAAKSIQLCLSLCDPRDGSPLGSPVPGLLQARTLEWVAISFFNASKWKVKVKSLVMSNTVRPHGQQPTRLLRPWDSPGKSTGVGCHCLLHHRAMRMAKIFKCWQWCEALEILIHCWWECKMYRHLGRFLQNHT